MLLQGIEDLRPLQALAASLFFKHGRLLLILPRQYGGKTELGLRLLRDITRRPFPSSSLFLAKDKPSAKKMTYEKFVRLFDKDIFSVNTERTILKEFPTSIIFQGACDKDPSRNRGGTYSFVHWAEVAFAKLEQGETISGLFGKIIVPTLSQTHGMAFLESTCNGMNGWKDIWDDYKSFGFARLRVSFSQMLEMGLVSLEDYEREKNGNHPDIFRQEYECEWVSFRGRAYKELNDDNLWEEMPGPEPWQRVIMAIDWGYHPSATCVLFAYVRDGIIHVFDEFYAKEQRTDQIKEAIFNRLRFWQAQSYASVADHEQDRIDELNLAGIPCSPANKVDVFGCRMEIKTKLWNNTILINPRTCPYLCKDLEAAVWDDKEDGELDYDECTWGHLDAEGSLRYLVRELGKAETEEPEKNPHHAVDEISAKAWLDRKQRERSLFND